MMERLVYLRIDRPGPSPIHLSADDLPVDLDAAYAALARLTAKDPGRWGAWKLGGTNAGSRAAFGVDKLYYGAIAQDEILYEVKEAPQAPLCELKGEVEIALRIDRDCRSWDRWAVALEMPASPLSGLVELGVVALVADRCAAGALVLGPEQSGPLPASDAHLVQEIDGRLASQGMPGLLTAPPEELFADFLTMAAEHGAPIMPGQWVATGGITACLSYSPGAHVTVRLDGNAVIEVVVAQRPGDV